jgi:hypothetical protein
MLCIEYCYRSGPNLDSASDLELICKRDQGPTDQRAHYQLCLIEKSIAAFSIRGSLKKRCRRLEKVTSLGTDSTKV